MELFVADGSGFCFGVEMAITRAYEEIKSGKVLSFGSLIHNKNVTKDLEEKGLRIVYDFDSINDEKIIIRAHGVPKKIFEELEIKGIEVIDCTCPVVSKIQKMIELAHHENKKVIITGNPKHPEVIGLNGWCENEAFILENVQDARGFSFNMQEKYLLFSQTTFNNKLFEEVIEVLLEKNHNLEINNTICGATLKNQKSAEQISKNVDLMLVLGDKNSSNTTKLFEICLKNQKNTYLIETISEIELKNLRNNGKIGIVGGASTPPSMIKEAISLMSEFEIDNTGTEENQEKTFEMMLDESMVSLHTGDIVTGTVILVSHGEVLVNLGYKSDGIITRDQYSEDMSIDPAVDVKPGDEIEVFVVRVNDGEGNVLLSKKRVDSQKGLKELEAASESGETIKGRITEVVKGGLIANVNGTRAFVPSSQISNRYVEDLKAFVGKEFDFNVLQFEKAKRRIVIGRKDLCAKEAESSKKELFEKIEEGDKILGTVTRITDFGAFVDIGGIDGLVHISELSWGRVKKVTEILKEGQEIEVTVLNVDREKSKVSLSLKDVKENPWATVEEKYPVGKILETKVVRMVPFGVFVELEPGVDGLVHISQIADKHVQKPEDELKIGQFINVKITEVTAENKKISLSKRLADIEADALIDAEMLEKVNREADESEVVAEIAVLTEYVSEEVIAEEVAADAVAADAVAADAVEE